MKIKIRGIIVDSKENVKMRKIEANVKGKMIEFDE